jgi:hypothetical protein
MTEALNTLVINGDVDLLERLLEDVLVKIYP